jgi:uncharacterized protein
VITLAVIAKAPQAGRSKTRLCPPCTPAQAAGLAAAALADTLAAMAATPAKRRVVLLDGAPGSWRREASRSSGSAAMASASASPPGSRTSADRPSSSAWTPPQVGARLLTLALRRLARADAVLGPPPNGGYRAIGLRREAHAASDDVPMSAPRTCAAQSARLRELGLGTAPLPPLRDVDDAVAVAALVPRSRFARELATMWRQDERSA